MDACIVLIRRRRPSGMVEGLEDSINQTPTGPLQQARTTPSHGGTSRVTTAPAQIIARRQPLRRTGYRSRPGGIRPAALGSLTVFLGRGDACTLSRSVTEPGVDPA